MVKVPSYLPDPSSVLPEWHMILAGFCIRLPPEQKLFAKTRGPNVLFDLPGGRAELYGDVSGCPLGDFQEPAPALLKPGRTAEDVFACPIAQNYSGKEGGRHRGVPSLAGVLMPSRIAARSVSMG